MLLPDGELAAAERALDAATLGDLLAAPAPTKVDLRVPKWRVRTQVDLTDTLHALGVRTMFTSAADLTGISADERLAVQAVLHEAVLDVDERGVEGAAATAVLLRRLSLDLSRPLPVLVDRPFLLLVRHAATGAIYFMARVTDPR